MHSMITGTAQEYISDMITLVSKFEGHAHLRSATLRQGDGIHDLHRSSSVL